jgi:diguanylate cyclase (GGDEF)-like protein
MMRDVLFKKWTIVGLLVLLVCILITLIEYIFQRHQEMMFQEVQNRTEEELASVRFQLEAAIFADIYVARSLSTLMVVNAGTVATSWEKIARRMIGQGKFIRALVLAPNDVIQYIYPPEEGHRKMIGLDLRQFPQHRLVIQQARQLKGIVVAGPLNWVDQKTAVVVHSPIFLDPPYNQFYWGIVSIVIDTEKLFSSLNTDFLSQGYQVAVRSQDSIGRPILLWGDPDIFNHMVASEKIFFPQGAWTVVLAEKGDILARVSWLQRYIVRVIGYPLLLLIIASFLVIYRYYDKSNRLSMFDELTRLPNRRYFMTELNREFEREKRAKHPTGFALLCIDIDKFKQINDQYGHIIGDQVLVECARRISNAIRNYDCAARFGGDEFLVLLAGGDTEHEWQNVSERVQKSVSVVPVVCGDYAIPVRVSVGFACYRDEMKNASEMIKYADHHMYHEKFAASDYHPRSTDPKEQG